MSCLTDQKSSGVIGCGNSSRHFVVRVGDESFDVDRDLVSSNSQYFAAMSSYDTVENQLGIVDMKEVTPYAVKQCLDFMSHNGELDIALRDELTAGDILHAAEIMQLPVLSQICFEFLEKILQPDNCMTILNLALKFSHPILQEKAHNRLEYVFKVGISQFVHFSESEFTDFVNKRYQSGNFNKYSHLEAIINWIKYDIADREQFVTKLFDHLKLDIFASHKFIRHLWNHLSQACKDVIYEMIFMDTEAFHSSLTTDNFFVIEKISEEFRFIPKQVRKRLADFMRNNFIALSSQPEFLHLTEEHFLNLFLNDDEDYLPPEKCKWNAAIRWVRYDNRRLSVLPTIMKTIKFDILSKTFIATNIRNEPLVKASSECSKLLMDSMFMDKPERNPKTFIAVLYSESRIAVYDCANNTWDEIPNVPKGSTSMICSFNDKLCLLVDEKLYYLNKNQDWISMRSRDLKLGTNDRVTASDDSIYIIDKICISEYNANTDSWKIFTHRKNLLYYGAIVTSSLHRCLCFFNDGGVRMFDIGKLKWKQHGSPIQVPIYPISSVCCEEIIYCISNDYETGTFDLKTQSYQNVKVISTPQTRGSKLWSLIVDGKLVVADDTNNIYVYVDLCKQWLKMTSIPLYAGKMDKKSTILSVCSFIR